MLKELELDKQFAMLRCCASGKENVEAHQTAFTEFADAHWESALRNVSPSLLWAIKLSLQRERIASTFVGEYRDTMHDIAWLVGNALTRAAIALPESILKEAPLLENIGLYRPALTGVDMELYNSPASRTKLVISVQAQLDELKGSDQK